ncbi:hypothetical protein EDF51_106127 [Curtobacterium sp. PhB25]|uniref:hypothetical protein n=1 Tax=Curtobacterium sp. PhB25 TaxID=2485205 RepID=UPI001064A6BE|nr:hypothetical protein [Curtobacterium sp. PhB25]TDW69143.1 hypothetical protein EDF51_106127 [Curtobacterium sp. PhB25]
MTTIDIGPACPPDHKHAAAGTCYNQHGCRCRDCTTTRATTQRARRREKAYGRYQPLHLPARGAQRRLQALIRQGWSQKKLARELGIPASRVYQLLVEERITRAWHDRIDQLFGRLWDKVPAHTEHRDLIAYNRTIRYAASRGWARPLEWDDIDNDDAPVRRDRTRSGIDETAVELAVAGTRVHLTISERREAVRILHGYGLTDPDMAKRLELSDRTILRIRLHELHLPANDSPHNSQPAAPAAA